MCSGAHGAGPGSFWQNLTRGDLPLPERLARIAANNWLKVSRRQACCGHHGEPGCQIEDALQTGELAAERYASYQKLLKEQRHQELRRDARARAEEKQCTAEEEPAQRPGS